MQEALGMTSGRAGRAATCKVEFHSSAVVPARPLLHAGDQGSSGRHLQEDWGQGHHRAGAGGAVAVPEGLARGGHQPPPRQDLPPIQVSTRGIAAGPCHPWLMAARRPGLGPPSYRRTSPSHAFQSDSTNLVYHLVCVSVLALLVAALWPCPYAPEASALPCVLDRVTVCAAGSTSSGGWPKWSGGCRPSRQRPPSLCRQTASPTALQVSMQWGAGLVQVLTAGVLTSGFPWRAHQEFDSYTRGTARCRAACGDQRLALRACQQAGWEPLTIAACGCLKRIQQLMQLPLAQGAS